MDHAQRVGVAQGLGQLDADLEHHLDAEALLGHQGVERAAVEQLHGDVGITVGHADVVDGDDVGVRERAGGLGLAQEAGGVFAVRAQLGLEHLDRQVALDVRVIGAVDVGHGAFADTLADLVASEQMSHTPSLSSETVRTPAMDVCTT